MNKPASELIALADAIHAWQQNPATTYTPTNILQDHGDTVVELARLAANQSGRDRAIGDAQPAPASDEASTKGCDCGVMCQDLRDGCRYRPSEAPHGKPDEAVRETVCCSAISPCEYQRTHRTGVCETCQQAAAIDRHEAEAKSQEPDAVAYMVERKSDRTFPRFYSSRADADALVECVNVSPAATIRPLYAHPTTKPEAPAVSVSRRLEQVAKIMRSARNNKKQMDVWADDVKIVEDAIAALIDGER